MPNRLSLRRAVLFIVRRGYHSALRPSMAWDKVLASRYSSSPPKGTPQAIRLALMP